MLVGTHQLAVANDIGTENGGQFPFDGVGHGITPGSGTAMRRFYTDIRARPAPP
jgi:hypothetical protein